MFKALFALGNALDSTEAAQSVKEFIANRNVTQWDHVFHDSRTNYTTEMQTLKCSIRSNLAFRINGSWSIFVSVTNDRPAAFRRARERISLREVYRF